MDMSEIQDLIKFVSKSGVTEVEIERKEFKITIKAEAKLRRGRGVAEQPQMIQQMPAMAMPAVQPYPLQAAAPAPVAAAPAPAAPVAEAPAEDNSKYLEVRSPMIGTFYRSSAPDKPFFKEVGDTVKVGETVCIIEAMKLFNEIESEVTGKIVKILVDDSTPVEYDQPLMLVDPS